MSWIRILCVMLLLGWSSARADIVVCPYDVSLEEPHGTLLRTLTLNRPTLLAALRTAVGVTDRDTPWTSELEIAGTARNAANRAQVQLPFSTLTPRLQQDILDTGCTVEADNFLGPPARIPRVVDGQLNFDRDDTTRPVVNPQRHGLDRNRTTYQWPRQDAFRSAFSLLMPREAWASHAAGPVTDIIDNANRTAEDPLSQGGLWTGTNVFNGTATLLATNGTQFIASNTSNTYRAATHGPNMEGYVTFANIGTDNSGLYVRITNPTVAINGYNCQFFATAGTLRIVRRDAGTGVLLGTAITQAIDPGDAGLCRAEGDSISVHFNNDGAGWVVAGTRTDGTWDTAGHLALQMCQTAPCTFDDLGGGTLPSTSFCCPFWRH